MNDSGDGSHRRMVHIRSASVASCPSTLACTENFQMPHGFREPGIDQRSPADGSLEACVVDADDDHRVVIWFVAGVKKARIPAVWAIA
jgi:hypothetical protein